MRKIVVFDTGWGGELVADYLMEELEVVEIVRVIDWAHKVYIDHETDIDEVASCLEVYIGSVDLIVLGGYRVGTLLYKLRERYPEQAFLAPGINYDKILNARRYPEKVAVLASSAMSNSDIFGELRQKLGRSMLILPDCDGWEELIDSNLMTRDVLRTELGWDFETQANRRYLGKSAEEVKFSAFEMLAERSLEKRSLMQAIERFSSAARQASLEEAEALAEIEYAQTKALSENSEKKPIRPDLVLILNTHFWEIKSDIEAVLGWRVRVLDFREKLLRDVCSLLKLRGVDGKRPK